MSSAPAQQNPGAQQNPSAQQNPGAPQSQPSSQSKSAQQNRAAQQSPQPRSEPAATGPKPAQIDRNGVLILIRSSLLALDHANRTGNYTVLRDISAPGFQVTNTAARLSEVFANLRAQNLDLSGVAVLDPQLTTLPQVEANGLMRMAGVFPSVPLQVNFDLAFAPVEGKWRLFGISVGLGQSTPSAPVAQQSQGPGAKPAEQASSSAAPASAAPTRSGSGKPSQGSAPKQP